MKAFLQKYLSFPRVSSFSSSSQLSVHPPSCQGLRCVSQELLLLLGLFAVHLLLSPERLKLWNKSFKSSNSLFKINSFKGHFCLELTIFIFLAQINFHHTQRGHFRVFFDHSGYCEISVFSTTATNFRLLSYLLLQKLKVQVKYLVNLYLWF